MVTDIDYTNYTFEIAGSRFGFSGGRAYRSDNPPLENNWMHVGPLGRYTVPFSPAAGWSGLALSLLAIVAVIGVLVGRARRAKVAR